MTKSLLKREMKELRQSMREREMQEKALRVEDSPAALVASSSRVKDL